MNAHAFAPSYTPTALALAAERKARLRRFDQAAKARQERQCESIYRKVKPFVPPPRVVETDAPKPMMEPDRIFWHSQRNNPIRSEKVWMRTAERPRPFLLTPEPVAPDPIVMLVDVVARECGIPPTAIMCHSRSQRFVDARHMVMYLARVTTDLSFPQIAKKMGGRDHSTVVHGRNKIGRLVAAGDSDTCRLINACTAELRARGYLMPDAC